MAKQCVAGLELELELVECLKTRLWARAKPNCHNAIERHDR